MVTEKVQKPPNPNPNPNPNPLYTTLKRKHPAKKRAKHCPRIARRTFSLKLLDVGPAGEVAPHSRDDYSQDGIAACRPLQEFHHAQVHVAVEGVFHLGKSAKMGGGGGGNGRIRVSSRMSHTPALVSWWLSPPRMCSSRGSGGVNMIPRLFCCCYNGSGGLNPRATRIVSRGTIP